MSEARKKKIKQQRRAKFSAFPLKGVKQPSAEIRRKYDLNSTQSPLLRLPSELRNRIYDYVFASENKTSQFYINRTILIRHRYWEHKWRQKNNVSYKEDKEGGFYNTIIPRGTNPFEANKNPSRQPSTPPSQLFRVCKQLFHETSVLSRRRVTALCFDNAYVMNRYLKEGRMSLAQRKAIRVLFCQSIPCKTTLKKFSGLRDIIQWIGSSGVGKHDGFRVRQLG